MDDISHYQLLNLKFLPYDVMRSHVKPDFDMLTYEKPSLKTTCVDTKIRKYNDQKSVYR